MDVKDESPIHSMSEYVVDQLIREYEDQILAVMKARYEEYPTAINDKEWLDYTNYFCQRRCQRVHLKESNDNT